MSWQECALLALGVAFFTTLMYASIYAAAAHDKLDKVNERLNALEETRKEAE